MEEEDTYANESYHSEKKKKKKKKKSHSQDEDELKEEVEEIIVPDDDYTDLDFGETQRKSPKKKKKKKSKDPLHTSASEHEMSPVPTTSKAAVMSNPGPKSKKVNVAASTSKATGPAKKTPATKKVGANEAKTAPKPATPASKTGTEEGEVDLFSGMQILTVMSQDDIEELLKRIEAQSPMDDKKTDKAREAQIRWGEVAFSSYGPVQCKSAWSYLRAQARKFRILHEVVTEIKVNFNANYSKFMRRVIETSPEYPKLPYATGGFTVYCKELWDGHKMLQQRMNAKVENFLAFQTKCYQDWPNVSERKKEEYHERAQVAVAEYQKRLKAFYAKYPGFIPKKNKPNKDGDPEKPPQLTGAYKRNALKISNELYKDAPQIPSTPLQLFVNSKINRLVPPPTLNEIPELKSIYFNQYKELRDSKKLKWIQKCVKKSERYLEDIQEYKRSHPLYLLPKEFKISQLINREEFALWAKGNGEPKHPFTTAYDLFFDEFRNSKEEGIEGKDDEEIRQMAHAKWQSLDKYKKKMYQMTRGMKQMEFQKEYEEYLTSLPQLMRARALDNLPKKFRKFFEEFVDKIPLVLPDEEPIPVNSKGKRKLEGEESSQDEGDGSPSKKKKKRKKDEGSGEQAKRIPLYMQELTDEHRKLIDETMKSENVMKSGIRNPNADSDEEDDDAATGTKKVSKKKPKFPPGKEISQNTLSEAIRGIFDGSQERRMFSVYYYYAKYVIREDSWNGIMRKCGVVRTAGKMIETFNRLSERQQKIFRDEAHRFHKQHRKYTLPTTTDELISPKLRYFPGEPRPPPRNAEALYNFEMKLKRRDLEDEEEANAIVPWDKLTEKEQMPYLKRLYKLNRDYVMKYEKFVKLMTPNDMAHYTVTRCQEWARKGRAISTYQNANRVALVAGSRDVFASEAYRAELSDDGQESEPEIYELNGSLSSATSHPIFKYKQAPFKERANQVNKYVLAKEKKRVLRIHKNAGKWSKKFGVPEIGVECDIPSSDEDEREMLAPNKLEWMKEKAYRSKIRELQRYYYPLEDLYDLADNDPPRIPNGWWSNFAGCKEAAKRITEYQKRVQQERDEVLYQNHGQRKEALCVKQSQPLASKPSKRKLKPNKGTRKIKLTTKLCSGIPRTIITYMPKPKSNRKIPARKRKQSPASKKPVPKKSIEIEESSSSSESDEPEPSSPEIEDTSDMTRNEVAAEEDRGPSLMLVTSTSRESTPASPSSSPQPSCSSSKWTKIDHHERSSIKHDLSFVESNAEQDVSGEDATLEKLNSPELFPEEMLQEEADPYAAAFVENQFTTDELDGFNF